MQPATISFKMVPIVAPASSQGATKSQSPNGTLRNRSGRATAAVAQTAIVMIMAPERWSLFAIAPSEAKISLENMSQAPSAQLAQNIQGKEIPRTAAAA